MPSTKNPHQIVNPVIGSTGSAGVSSEVIAALTMYGGGPDWADGTTNPITSINGQLTKILVDLSSLSGGTAKLGSAPLVGANDTIAAGTLYTQLVLLKQAEHIEYNGNSSWLDGAVNGPSTVEAQLDKIVDDLVVKDGSSRIGSATIVGSFNPIPQGSIFDQLVTLKQTSTLDGADIIGATNTIPAADLHTQLVALKQSSNIEYAGGGSWLDGTTNPASRVELQLDKIVSDLVSQTSGASGAHRLGCASIIGSSGTITSGSIHATLTSLKQSSNIEYTGGTSWADGTTNSSTSVELQIDKIIADLAGISALQSGVRKIGAELIEGLVTTISSGTLRSQLISLQNGQNLDVDTRSSWLGGRTNPAATIFAALDKIYIDLGDTASNDDGMERIGAQAVAGSPYSLNVGSSRSHVNQLLQYLNTEAWGRFAGNNVGPLGNFALIKQVGITSAVANSSYITITFATAFADTDYMLLVVANDSSHFWDYVARSDTTTTCRVYVYLTGTNTLVDPTINALTFSLYVRGDR